METITDFIFLGSKITMDSAWGHEIKRHLFIEMETKRKQEKQHSYQIKHAYLTTEQTTLEATSK